MTAGRSLALCLCAVMTACRGGIPEDALKLSSESLADRQIQTRRFETEDELRMLQASTALLQDLGFNLDESDLDVGVLVASKERSAVRAEEVAAAVFLTLLGAVGGSSSAVPWDERQLLRASIVTRPIKGTEPQMTVRVTFQRIVWNTDNQVTKREGIREPEVYQEFFEKLSKAVFLEAHEL